MHPINLLKLLGIDMVNFKPRVTDKDALVLIALEIKKVSYIKRLIKITPLKLKQLFKGFQFVASPFLKHISRCSGIDVRKS